MTENEIGREIVDAAIKIHTALGPGLLESAYEGCMKHELTLRQLRVKCQVPMPLRYRDATLDVGYRVDLLIEDKVVVELKTVDVILPIHSAQLLSYLKLGSHKLGFVLNFNTVHMRDGIKRMVRGL